MSVYSSSFFLKHGISGPMNFAVWLSVSRPNSCLKRPTSCLRVLKVGLKTLNLSHLNLNLGPIDFASLKSQLIKPVYATWRSKLHQTVTDTLIPPTPFHQFQALDIIPKPQTDIRLLKQNCSLCIRSLYHFIHTPIQFNPAPTEPQLMEFRL